MMDEVREWRKKLVQSAGSDGLLLATLVNALPSLGHLFGSWHKIFAWMPVRTYDNRRVWLRYVWRKKCRLKDYLWETSGGIEWWVYSLDGINPKEEEGGGIE